MASDPSTPSAAIASEAKTHLKQKRVPAVHRPAASGSSGQPSSITDAAQRRAPGPGAPGRRSPWPWRRDPPGNGLPAGSWSPPSPPHNGLSLNRQFNSALNNYQWILTWSPSTGTAPNLGYRSTAVVTRYRIHLESRQLAPGTMSIRRATMALAESRGFSADPMPQITQTANQP